MLAELSRSGLEPDATCRVVLELVAAHGLRLRRNVSLEEALDRLTQGLDIDCLLLQPEHEKLKAQLDDLLARFDLDALPVEELLTLVDLLPPGKEAERLVGAFSPPDWLVRSFVALIVPGEPVGFWDFGASTLVPRVLYHWAQADPKTVEFVSGDTTTTIVESLRLMTSLVLNDLDQVRESVRLGAGLLAATTRYLFDVPNSDLESHRSGTLFVNLLSPIYDGLVYRQEIGQLMATYLSQTLTANGRAVLLGPTVFLYEHRWARFREELQSQLHVEAVVDLSFDREPPSRAFAPVPTALILLRQPQQSRARRVTVFAPGDPDGFAPGTDNPLDHLLSRLEGDERPIESETVFEQPTSELVDRWDPKFYYPARLRLQDRLINSPQVAWLGGITQLIERGPSPSLLKPNITTRIAGVTFEGRQEAMAHLKAGDQVWLRREPNDPHDPNAVHVERRSGTSLGWLPADLAADVVEPLDQLGGKLKATVTETHGGTAEAPHRGATIQFAPPQNASAGESVLVVRPRDITNNRLTGAGEVAWLSDEHREKIPRLQAGDILLYLRGFGKACVVPRESEGAICHRDFAIIRPNEDIDPLYLLSFILGSAFQEQLRFVARGPTVPSVELRDLAELLVIMPPLATQRRVAMAFAESQGELGAGLKENLQRWVDLLQSDEMVDQQWMSSTLLSNLFSDWDRMHTLDDWVRLKGDYVRELRNLVAHGPSPFANEAIDLSMVALGDLSRTIEEGFRDPNRWSDFAVRAEQKLVRVSQHLEQCQDPLLRRRFSTLVDKLSDLLKATAAPLPVQLQLDQAVLPAGVPVLLGLAITNHGNDPVDQLEIIPCLSSGDVVDKPAWRLQVLEPGQTHSFEAHVRFGTPGTVDLDCAVSYTRKDGYPFQQTTQLVLEVVPREQVPFTPIRPNPYITGGAVNSPEMFFGRQDVLDFLSANLIGQYQSNVIILQGNRRTGKSSILKQVVNQDLFRPDIPVYVDCQGLGKLTDRRFFFKLADVIWKALASCDDVDPPPRVKQDDLSEEDPFYDFKEVLDQLVAAIPGRRIILLIDEFEVIDSAIQKGDLSPIVLENLRHLFQHRDDLAVVLTGSHRLTRLSQDYWSILFGLGLKYELGFLDEHAARQLVTRPLEGAATYSEESVERIIQLTASQPYFVQVICHDVVNVLNEEEMTYVTQSHVENAAQQTLVSADGHMRFMFESIRWHAGQAVLVFLATSLSGPDTLPGHEIEAFVDRYGLPITNDELGKAMKETANRDIIHIQDANGQRRYGFKIDLVRQWIRRNYDLQSAIALAQSTSYLREE